MARKSSEFLDKDAFLRQSKNLRKVVCELPELGGKVYVRELSGKSLLAYNERIKALQADGTEITASNSVELMCFMVSLTVVDTDGNLMFAEDEAAGLADGSLSVLLTLSQAAMEVSGINAEAMAEVTSKLKNDRNSSSSDS